MNLLPKLKSPLLRGQKNYQDISPPERSHVLCESSACRQLVTEKMDEICREVLQQRMSRSPHVQQALLILLPRLAAFNREKFVSM